MKDALKEIVAKKKERLLQDKQTLGLEELKQRIAAAGPIRSFRQAISKPRNISLIAEIKKQSPSRGLIRQDFDHRQIASIYQELEVQAVSVVTEQDYFAGAPEFLSNVRDLVKMPLLRKDFIFDPYQVYESRALGADAILLIADLLTKDAIQELSGVATELGMDSLVEVHSEKELKKVLNLKMPLLGINNRDLHTLEVDLKTTERLYTLIPRDKTVVVESGIKTYQDTLFLKILGVNAVLIGEAFMEAPDIRKKVEEVMGW